MGENVWSDEIERHNFIVHVDYRIQVPDKTILAAEYGIGLTWNLLAGSSESFRISFEDWIISRKTGKPANIASRYESGTGVISFGVESDSFKSFHLPQAETSFLAGSHEAAHKMQLRRGDVFPSSDEPSDEEYINRPEEIEAWEVALNIFKYVYPKASGYIVPHGRRFDIPEKSRF